MDITKRDGAADISLAVETKRRHEMLVALNQGYHILITDRLITQEKSAEILASLDEVTEISKRILDIHSLTGTGQVKYGREEVIEDIRREWLIIAVNGGEPWDGLRSRLEARPTEKVHEENLRRTESIARQNRPL